jgi:transcriptional regulator with XRE-family HTH domain
MPRVKPDSERGYVGAWMRRERLARGWSETQVVEALAVKIRPDYYRQIEAGSGGKQPGPELLLALMDLFGSAPTPFPEAPADPRTADFASLVAAQTELLARQNELLASQVAVLERIAAALQALAPLAEAPAPGGSGIERLVRDLVETAAENAARQIEAERGTGSDPQDSTSSEPSHRNPRARSESSREGSPR